MPPNPGNHLVDFAIIGAQKSGSTLVHDYLRGHQEVWMRRDEQPHLQDPYYSPAAVNDLRRLLAEAPQKAQVGIKRPAYLARPEVPARMHELAPQAKLILALRDPVRRAVSAYAHYRHYGMVPNVSARDGLRMIIEGQIPSRYRRAGEVLEYGKYGEQLSRWRNWFDRSQFLVLRAERLRSDGETELRRIDRFLGIPPAALPPPSANPGPYSPVRRTFMRVVRTALRLGHADGATALAEHPAGRKAMAFDDGWLADRFSGKPDALDDELTETLSQYYLDDQRRLAIQLRA